MYVYKFMFVCVFTLAFVLVGCSMSHGRFEWTPPPSTEDDAGPLVAEDAGLPPVVETDAGEPTEPDTGPVEPDSGSSEDAGSDAGTPEIDGGSGRCEAVVVPADGSGQVVIRVEGGGDMTVPQDTDFVAFSVIIENHTLGSIEGFASFHESTLSEDCTVSQPSFSFNNECDETNSYHPTAGSCGGLSCGMSCAERGPIFASGTSTRFTAYGHTYEAGRFQTDISRFEFRDASGVLLPSSRIVGLDMTPAIATITVPAVVSDLIIEPYNLRQSAILVAGGDVWHNVASFRVGADESIPSFDVYLDGDAADIREVAIAADGYVLGSGWFSAGTDTMTTIELREPFITPPDAPRTFMVWVKIPNVMSNIAVGGVRDGNPMSGDTLRIGVGGADRLISSDRLHSAFGPIMGNEFVIRRSKPTITREPLTSSLFFNGMSNALYRWNVSADAAGSVAIYSIPFNVNARGAFTLSNFGVLRNSALMPTEDYEVFDEELNRLEPGSLAFEDGETHRILIVFLFEQTITGAGYYYTLQATPSGVDVGDAVTLSFDRTSHGMTGYLVDDPISPFSAIDVSPWGAVGTTPPIAAGFVWSDLSEIPHSDFYGCCGGSRDWTDASLLEDLTQTQTLSR